MRDIIEIIDERGIYLSPFGVRRAVLLLHAELEDLCFLRKAIEIEVTNAGDEEMACR